MMRSGAGSIRRASTAPIVALAVLALASACSGSPGGDSTNLEKPGPSSTRTSPWPSVSSVTPSPPETSEPIPTSWPSPTPVEPELSCPRKPLLGVYSPSRLRVLGACRWFVGRLARMQDLPDGDLRLWLIPAHGYGRFLNAANLSAGHAQLPAVVIQGQPMQFILPSIGERVAVWGTWVRNIATGWNEMHPIWEIRYGDGGTLIYAIPPVPPEHPSG